MTTTTDNGGLRELALFAGAGGGILGGLLLGWRTVCAVEWDAYAASVLVARQDDGTLSPFPIWDDVQTFDGRSWRGAVDVVSGGFPCTDISAAGKGAGIDGNASGMWRHMARIIGEVQPRHVFVENSPMLIRRGLARVLGDLAAMGYDARWGIIGAADVGAPHQRDRIWIVADARHMCGGHGSESAEQEEPATARRSDDATDADGDADGQQHVNETPRHDGNGAGEDVADANGDRTHGASASETKRTWPSDEGWWTTEPDVGRVAHGVAHRVDRLRCTGNGQVPRVAAVAWEMMR